MNIIIADIETNGLLDEMDRMWCFCAMNYKTKEKATFQHHEKEGLFNYLTEADYLIGHNFLGFDLPALTKLFGLEWSTYKINNSLCKTIDTYCMSMYLFPDRPREKGYPGKGGPHSLDMWGYRVGRYKPTVNDWQGLDIQEYIHRCEEDVEITALVYDRLLQEQRGYK